MTAIFVALLAAAAAGSAVQAGSQARIDLSLGSAARQGGPVSDTQILAYATQAYDRDKLMFKREVLGRHNGLDVVADHPCSDVCPRYTVRIVHYDIGVGPECAKAGGVVRDLRVPMGPGAVTKAFCMPRVLSTLGRAPD